MTSHWRLIRGWAGCAAGIASAALILSACGGSPGAATDDDVLVAMSEADELRNTVTLGLRRQLIEEVGLTDAETDCVSAEVMTAWNDVEALIDQPQALADEILESVQAAEETCFTSDRLQALETSTADSAAAEPDYEAGEEAFLVAMAGVPGVAGEPSDLLNGGRTVCALAVELGSVTSFLATVTPGSATTKALSAELAPSLGSTLTAADLKMVSLVSVVGLCPEINDL